VKRYVMLVAALILVGMIMVVVGPIHYIVCDAWGPSTTQLAGEVVEWTEPPWYATEAGAGCYQVPGWAFWER
jgi:hypothetical protein